MYKVASKNAQDAARALRVSDLERGELVLSDEDRRASLVAKWKHLHGLVTGTELSKAAKKKVGHEMLAIQHEITAIRPKKKHAGMENILINVIRESVTPAQFAIWVREASRRFDDESAAA